MSKLSSYRIAITFIGLAFCAMPLLGQDAKPIIREFHPVSAAELAMKDEPNAPGVHAEILEWTIDRDDKEAREFEYLRIKIFTEEGRKHADVEIPYSNRFNIAEIRARTIQPDGTILPFNGKVFDKVVVKTNSYQFKAKTFTLPGVRPGSIFEFHFRRTWDNRLLYTAHWDLQRELFVRRAKFAIKPYADGIYFPAYVSMGLTKEQQPVTTRDGYLLTLENLPAFEEEPFSPPESQIKPNISFYYTARGSDSPEQFWNRYAKETSKESESFIGNRSGIRQAVTELVAATDTPELKLRKIYARVQQVRNLSYASTLGTQEQERVAPKENKTAEDVLKNGYGYRRQINRLFVAMARAAGIDATVARVSQRDTQFFQRLILDESQLDSEITVVRLGDKQMLLDPATPFSRFGMLSWENTGVDALAINKDGGQFFNTPMPDATDAAMRRNADLTLDAEGNLKGTATVELDGHYAHRRRIESLDMDDAEQKKTYESLMEGWLPAGSQIKLVKVTGKTEAEQPLRLEYTVEIPSITSDVGARTMAPFLIFQAKSTNPFAARTRVHPIYFQHPYDDIDKIRVTLPPETKVETLPLATAVENGFASYRTKWERDETSVTVTRQETMNGFSFAATDQPHLRGFFSKVNAGDKEAAVLRVKKQ